MDRHTDLMKQGFMKPAKDRKEKKFDEAAWRKRTVEAARKYWEGYNFDD